MDSPLVDACGGVKIESSNESSCSTQRLKSKSNREPNSSQGPNAEAVKTVPLVINIDSEDEDEATYLSTGSSNHKLLT